MQDENITKKGAGLQVRLKEALTYLLEMKHSTEVPCRASFCWHMCAVQVSGLLAPDDRL